MQVRLLLKILNDGTEEDLKIACILDEFTYNSFKFECNLLYLTPSNFTDVLNAQKIHLLFVESLWEGLDKQWGDVNSGANTDIAETIKQVVEYCKEKKIPTVFWNKEDPVHFYRFIDIARLFDFVFTTDENCVDSYREILGHNRVFIMPFAAQPAIHNPINRNAERLGKIAFAGSWRMYGHLRRKYDMKIVIKPSFKHGVSIYDRNYNRSDVRFRYPEEYEPYIKGSLSYNDTAEIYKKYDIFLNVNSVGKSPTMFSRRVFELLACGTNVISGYSIGVENFFPGIVPLCKMEDDTEYFLNMLLNNSELRDRLSLLGQREVFKYHTCKERLKYVLEKVRLEYVKENLPGVSIITWIDKPEDFHHVMESYSVQRYREKELILILRKNGEMVQEMQNRYKIKVLLSSEFATLEECFNKAVSDASFKYISLFNPSCFYGPEFIGDLTNVFLYTKPEIVGKHTYYAYAGCCKKLYVKWPGNEYKFTDFIHTYAMIIDKSVFSKVKFTFKSDGPMVDSMKAEGSVIMYASDRFNYAFESESMPDGVPDEKTLEVGCPHGFPSAVVV